MSFQSPGQRTARSTAMAVASPPPMQRGDAAFQVPRLRRMQQRHDQSRAGGTDRMSLSIRNQGGRRPLPQILRD